MLVFEEKKLIFSLRSRQKILFFDFLLWFYLYFATIPALTLCQAKSLESVLAHCDCFIDEQFYCYQCNGKEIIFCFSLPIGPNKIVHQENNNIRREFLVSLFSCFVNPFPTLL